MPYTDTADKQIVISSDFRTCVETIGPFHFSDNFCPRGSGLVRTLGCWPNALRLNTDQYMVHLKGYVCSSLKSETVSCLLSK